METAAIILAAGQGTRMKSDIPKVLHKIFNKPMLEYILDAVEDVQKKIVVLGHASEEIQDFLDENIDIAYQKEQLGTGHAVLQAKALLTGKEEAVLVLCGDTPLLRKETLENLLEKHKKEDAVVTVLTAEIKNPTGYGRIIRENNLVSKIVEEKDADLEEKKIKEINTGAYCFSGDFLLKSLENLNNNNKQNEYYLTDLISMAVEKGLKTAAFVLDEAEEGMGINNRLQLSEASRVLQRRINERLMLSGVSFIDPENTYVGPCVEIGQDSLIYPNVHLEGRTQIGKKAWIGPNTRIVDSSLGDNLEIQEAVILESKIGSNCKIGPFAYIRPETVLSDQVKIGDFVEVKKSFVDEGSKIPHLSYVGDSVVGKKVNIGCGTITCNYDGKDKHKTVIKDGAFIGSNTNLIAPVVVGEGATVGAGSTITKEVPKDSLALARQRQVNLDDWAKK